MPRLALLSLLLLPMLISTASGANILLVPFAHGFNSRLMNMQKIADLLMDAGHNASLLINSAVQEKVTNKRATWYVYQVPKNIAIRQSTDREWIDFMMHGVKNNNSIYAMVDAWLNFELPLCRALLTEGKMLPMLKAKNFDLMMIDIGDDCTRLISDYLDIPTILYSNYGFSHDNNIFYPQLLSFVCSPEIPDVCTSDEMDFGERLGNFITHFIMDFITNPYLHKHYDDLRKEFGYNVTLKSKESFNRHVMIANADFAIDFPRPLMPHIIPISGIFRKEPKPLSTQLQNFFDSSGEHGIVVLSFGTLVSALDETQAEIFAKVFAKLPQKVLWRHSGAKPKNLGANTMLIDWIPQNDILAHPNMALFITHCGIASTFESAIHGVPVVTVPLFADQRLNSARLVKRAKMGVQINIHTLNESELTWAIDHVVNTKSYRENAKATSRLMHDSPNSPKDLFLYWVDYVIRHNGAHHLQSGPVRRMSLMQYLGVDVLLTILAGMLGVLIVMLCAAYCLFKCVYSSITFNKSKLKES